MSKSAGLQLAIREADVQRFHAKVIITSTCWVWGGAVGGRDGYGRFALRRDDRRQRTVSAHVLAATVAYGAIPAGSTVLHDCDFRLCVRTDIAGHVRISTQTENVRQAVRRGRSRGPHPGMVDVRGPAGVARAVQDALRASPDRSPAGLALVLAQTLADGDPLRDNLTLFEPLP
ncbi:MAG: HNH endonuclease [Jatrophihabitantaceae bacterium]